MPGRCEKLVVLMVFLALAGCPLVDSTLTIDHTGVMTAMAQPDIPVYLVGVSDNRGDTRRIGSKKTGTGSESADLFLDVPLALWFGGVLNEELRRAGFRLAGTEDPAAVRLEVFLQHFFIEPEVVLTGFNIHAVVCAEVVVRFSDGSSFARRFASRKATNYMLVTDGNCVEIMQQAMEDWILQAVPAISELIKSRYSFRPQAGGDWRRWS